MAGAPALPRRADHLRPAHGAGNVLLVLASHGLLAAWFVLGFAWLPLALYVAGSLLVSVVHQKAMSEWIHEGGHFNLVADRRWNDRLTNALAGIWFGVSVDAYRSTHFPHHAQRGFFRAEDPDTSFLTVTTRRELRRAVLRDLCGLTMIREFLRFGSNEGKPRARTSFLLAAAAVHAALLAALFAAGRLDAYALYYASLATLYPLHNRLRVYGQHVTVLPDGSAVVVGSGTSRTIDAGFADRVLWTSPRLLHHHEHHRYPHLPWRALAGLCPRTGDGNVYARRRWPVLRSIYTGLP